MAALAFVRLVAIHLECDLCGDHARIEATEPVEDTLRGPALGWINSHLAPRIVHVECTTTPCPHGNGGTAS